MGQARISRKAEADLIELWIYIAEENVNAADDLVDLIGAKLALLQDNPELGVGRPELGEGLRSLPVKSFTVFYRPEPSGGIDVIRILHSARDVKPSSVD